MRYLSKDPDPVLWDEYQYRSPISIYANIVQINGNIEVGYPKFCISAQITSILKFSSICSAAHMLYQPAENNYLNLCEPFVFLYAETH